MPNILDGLIARIEDPSLRAEIIREIALLRDNKEFGLVFERHLPETIHLLGYPVGRGCAVVDRTNDESPTRLVRRVDKGVAWRGLAAYAAEHGHRFRNTLAVIKEGDTLVSLDLKNPAAVEKLASANNSTDIRAAFASAGGPY